MAGNFSYKQAEQISIVFKKYKVKYLFIGKSGAIILGYPDATQDVDIFPEKSEKNCKAIVSALLELGFPLTSQQQDEIMKGKDFVQIRNGPFDIDLIFAPDGIDSYEKALSNSVQVGDLPVCNIDDIIKSKKKAGRVRDKESLPRLLKFRDWLKKKRKDF